MFLELRILNELWARFTDLRILKDLAISVEEALSAGKREEALEGRPAGRERAAKFITYYNR